MDVYGKNPTSEDGKYFRANVWSWRPIHRLCQIVLKKDLPGWAFNDGDGFESQAECTDLADRIEAYLRQFPKEAISIESDIRVDRDGRFLSPGEKGGETPYVAEREHVEEFVAFLRSYGGFEIH
jgi:hypothetical protein